MEHVEAQQVAHVAHGVCRSMGHFYAYLPVGGWQRTHQCPTAAKRTLPCQLHARLRRQNVKRLQRTQGRTLHRPQRQGHYHHQPYLRQLCRRCGRAVGTTERQHRLWRQLHCGTDPYGRIPVARQDRQDGDDSRQVCQRPRPEGTTQGHRAQQEPGQGTGQGLPFAGRKEREDKRHGLQGGGHLQG